MQDLASFFLDVLCKKGQEQLLDTQAAGRPFDDAQSLQPLAWSEPRHDIRSHRQSIEDVQLPLSSLGLKQVLKLDAHGAAHREGLVPNECSQSFQAIKVSLNQ